MNISPQSYEIRMLDIQGIRNAYTPLITGKLERWSKSHIAFSEDLELSIDWMIKESIQDCFQCPIIGHYQSDLGKFLLNEFKMFMFEMRGVLQQLRAVTRSSEIKHIKVMVVGGILITATLYK